MPHSTYGLSGNPIRNETNVVTGSTSAVQFPSRPCIRAKFRANDANIGTFQLGASVSTVIWEMDAGKELNWIDIDNLNLLWHSNASGTADKLSYWLQY